MLSLKATSNMLKRRFYLGIICKEESSKVVVKKVISKDVNLQKGDIICKLNKQKVSTLKELNNMIYDESYKHNVELDIEREGKRIRVNSILIEYPEEVVETYKTIYDSFLYKGLGFRVIITCKNDRMNLNKNIVLLLQGVECNSIDIPFAKNHSYKELVYGLSENKISVARVDLFGNGDSEGDKCYKYTFNEIVDLYNEAIKYLNNKGFNVFLFGYSMGGVMAPILANVNKNYIKGVIIFDTIISSLDNYLLKNIIRQSMLREEKKEFIQEKATKYFSFLNKLLIEKKSLEEVLEEDTYYKLFLDKDNLFLGHTYRYTQQIQDIDIKKEWENVSQDILMIVGENDCAIDFNDHVSLYKELRKMNKEITIFVEQINHFFRKSDGKFSYETIEKIKTYLELRT